MFNKTKSQINRFYIDNKFKNIKQYFDYSDMRILDVGAGNHSATKMKSLFPNCKYYGIDISKNYNNNQEDFKLMEKFYEIDLTKLDFSSLQDDFFDLIIMSHIIEHLYNGDMVINNLIPKLKRGGIIYIEYPTFKSTNFPSMGGTLNFFDDNTHVRIYNLREIYNILLKNNISPLKGGVRRSFLRIVILPVVVPLRLLFTGKLCATDFWDLFGFAEYVIGKKTC